MPNSPLSRSYSLIRNIYRSINLVLLTLRLKVQGSSIQTPKIYTLQQPLEVTKHTFKDHVASACKSKVNPQNLKPHATANTRKTQDLIFFGECLTNPFGGTCDLQSTGWKPLSEQKERQSCVQMGLHLHALFSSVQLNSYLFPNY